MVEAYAFDSCEKLTTFTLSGNESFTLGSAFNDCNRLTTLTLKARKLTFGERFLSGTSIATLEIPTEVEHIEGNVYGTFRLSKVSEVKFAPNARLEVIGDYAFSYAENLSSITLPESVTTLGREVFAGCTLLRTLDLPATISVIGPTTFPIDLEVLKIRATTCPSVSVSLGSFSWLSEYNIQVPIGAVDAYKSHQAWSNCKSITALKD